MSKQDAVAPVLSKQDAVAPVLSKQDAPKGKQKSRLKITHAQNDARYVEFGRSLAIAKCAVPPNYASELAKANKHKNGSPYMYPESLIMSLAILRDFTKMSYRVLSGYACGLLGDDNAPKYKQLQRRIKGIKIYIKDNIITAHNKKAKINMAIDGTGCSPNVRSEYIRHRHKTKHGFIRVVFIVDTDTREILGFSVTDESVGEPQQFEPLVFTALSNLGITVPARAKPVEPQVQPPVHENNDSDAEPQVQPPVHENNDSDAEPQVQPPVHKNNDSDAEPQVQPPVHKNNDSDTEPQVQPRTAHDQKISQKEHRTPQQKLQSCQSEPEQPSQETLELESNLPEIIMRADGGFDKREIFKLCKDMGITAHIRIRHNARTRSRGVSRDRSIAALDQLGGDVTDPRQFGQLTKDEREANRKEWKKRVEYGKRWLVEIVISSFKRLFGDHISSRKWENIVQEINLKVNFYNRMLQIHRDAIANA